MKLEAHRRGQMHGDRRDEADDTRQHKSAASEDEDSPQLGMEIPACIARLVLIAGFQGTLR